MAYHATLSAVLTAVVRVLNDQRIEYALAGGLAYSALVTPRATVDIDVLALVPERPPVALFDGLRAALEVFIPHPGPMVFKRATIWRAVGGDRGREVMLDFILAESEFHRSALDRRRTVEFAGQALSLISVEDLMLLKALADRSQDRADIEGILARYETTLDRVYLGRWAERLGLDPGGVGGA